MFTDRTVDGILYRWAIESDVVEIAELHFKSFSSRENLLVAFGKSYVFTVYKWLLSTDKSIIIVAVNEGRIVGSAAVFLGAYNKIMLRATRWSVLAAFIKKPKLVFTEEIKERIIELLFKKRKYLVSPEKSIAQGIATNVDSSMRRRGIASTMWKIVIEICREKGCRKLISTTYPGNEAAKKNRLSLGFKEVIEGSSKNRCYYELEL